MAALNLERRAHVRGEGFGGQGDEIGGHGILGSESKRGHYDDLAT